ncbi:MAG TPA: YncE family protein, partial [Thermoplasmata archaeon]|nr:YncE family protein [Thermoplasmata archaeon]
MQRFRWPIVLSTCGILLLLVAGSLQLSNFNSPQDRDSPLSPSAAYRGNGEPSHDRTAAPQSSSSSWSPASGRSSPGVPAYRLATLPRASASCSQSYSSPAWLAYDPANTSIWVATPPSCVDEYTPAAHGFGFNFTTALPVGTDPFGVEVDNSTNEVFVTNTGSDNVTVISGQTNLVVGTVAVGGEPYGVAYDWASNDVYVANGGTNNVTIISATSLTVVGNVAVGSNPIGVAAAPQNGELFVADSGSANVTVISDVTNSVVTSIPTGNGSYGVALDNASDQIYVTNQGSNSISVIDAATDTLVDTVPVLAPWVDLQGIAYDPGTGMLWAGGGPSYAVVVNASTNSVVGYAGTDPSGVVYDPANGEVCVTNTANLTFECVTFASIGYPAVLLTFHEAGLPVSDSWQVDANYSLGGNLTTGISAAANISFGVRSAGGFSYDYRIPSVLGYIATPAQGVETLSGSSVVVNISFSIAPGAYPITFNETGLPTGATWQLFFNSTWSSLTTSSVVVWAANGTYNCGAYELDVSQPYLTYTPQFNVTVAGAAQAVYISFQPSYPAWFNETGLPSGPFGGWNIVITSGPIWVGGGFGGSSANISYPMLNGTYGYTVYANNNSYSPTPASGNYTINGSSANNFIQFALTGALVVFHQTGLVPGVYWNVVVSGANIPGPNTTNGTPTWGGNVTLGSYYIQTSDTLLQGNYSYVVNAPPGNVSFPSAGNFSVVAGQPLTIDLWFGPTGSSGPPPPPSYSVWFNESGLPALTAWSVYTNGSWDTGASNSIVVPLENGTYNYSVRTAGGYSAAGGEGFVTVRGTSANVTIAFSRVYYTLTFKETGLPNGTGWAISIASTIESSLSSSIQFDEPNGTYGFVILAINGYVTADSGFAVVNGSDQVVSVAFHPQTYPIVFIEFGLPAGSNWSVTVSNASNGFNETQSSTGSSITFFLPNGTYAFSFTLPPGFSGSSSSSQITVAGKATT